MSAPGSPATYVESAWSAALTCGKGAKSVTRAKAKMPALIAVFLIPKINMIFLLDISLVIFE